MIGNEKMTMFETIQRMSNTQRRPIRLRKKMFISSFLRNAMVRVARFPKSKIQLLTSFTATNVKLR